MDCTEMGFRKIVSDIEVTDEQRSDVAIFQELIDMVRHPETLIHVADADAVQTAKIE